MLKPQWFVKSKFIFIFVVIFFSTILLNNLVFYQATQDMLEDNFTQNSEIIAADLKESIAQFHVSSKFVEDLIGQELRTSAIAIQHELDPNYENVTNEQLVELSGKLGISHITLFKKTADDIIGVRSSDPKEIDISAKQWGFWYKALLQLYESGEVTISQGQKLPNYWAGPFEHSASNPSSIDKWGYYYDGTTNYIINPYVHDKQIREYASQVGYDDIVQRSMSQDHTILQITGFNPKLFGGKPREYSRADGTSFISLYNRDIFFGNYTLQHPSDVESVKQAISTGVTITKTQEIAGRKVLQSFIPVPEGKNILGKNYPYVIGVVSDYQEIQAHLDDQAKNAVYLIILATLMAALIIYLYVFYTGRAKENAAQVAQDQYIEDISRMFTTVRGQRHDFLNHVQMIHMLVQLGKYDELKKYTKQYVDEIVEVSDLIQINHPVIASQVQSKVASAIPRKIAFTHSFQSLDAFPLNALKSVDIVKMMGNLVDNAFDEVEKLPVEERHVELSGWVEDGRLHITVRNPCVDPPAGNFLECMFKPGVTSKEGEHHGLGLSIVKSIVEMYKGTVSVRVEGRDIFFHVILPANG